MSEFVSNQNHIKNSFAYPSPEMIKINREDEEKQSIFETAEENTGGDVDINEEEDTSIIQDEEDKIANLEKALKAVEDKQGWIGNAWNGIKEFTEIGSSAKNCRQAISDFKDGKITYEKVQSIISEFSLKQKNSVDLVANVASGVAAVGAATILTGTVIATAGLALPAIAVGIGIGVAAGAVTKAGIKFSDRATNNIDDDALVGKQILKDGLSGAVNGVAATATGGMGSVATTATTTLKSAVIQGAKSNAVAGTKAGSITGAGDYIIEAAVEDDVDFNAADFTKTVAVNAVAGAVTGGTIGGVAHGIKHGKSSVVSPSEDTAQRTLTNQVDETQILNSEANTVVEKANEQAVTSSANDNQKTALNTKQFVDLSKRLFDAFSKHINEATKQIESEFGTLSSSVEITGRAKGQDSILSKLIKKFGDGFKNNFDEKSLSSAIGDAYGIRLQMKSLNQNTSKKIIENNLKNSGVSYSDFVKYMNGDKSGMTDEKIKILDDINSSIIDKLKEKQTQEIVNKLIETIKNGKLNITELNNYGDEVTSYFTTKQLQQIADAYYQKTGKNLPLVTKQDLTKLNGPKFNENGELQGEVQNFRVDLNTSKAVKESGYTSTQMNIKHVFSDGTKGNGEFQIRGINVNQLAEVEHIPYDIRQGKITADDAKYSDIYEIITSMSDSTYKKYNNFLTATYRSCRLNELGIPTKVPDIKQVFKNKEVSEEALSLLSIDGLMKISGRDKIAGV